MANCFTKKYASYYDLLYKDKNYKKESDYLEKIFSIFLNKHPKVILDLACGTGNHALLLAKKGYEIVGIDASGDMIDIASKKAQDNHLKIEFRVNKMQNFNLHQKFDVVISMFSAIDYLTDYNDLKKTILNVRRHLKKDGLFIFDFWNGFIAIDYYIPRKTKIIKADDLEIKRISLSTLDILNHIINVKFKCFILRRNTLIDYIEEIHRMRFFFPEELQCLLSDAGFKVEAMYPFLSFRNKLTKKDWDITVVAKAHSV